MAQITFYPADVVWISNDYPTINNDGASTGAVGRLQLKEPVGYYTWRTLLRTDISSIPVGSIIADTSKVRLYVTDMSGGVGWAAVIYRCLRAWVESQATWNVWSTGNNWTTPGAGGYGTDVYTPLVNFTSPTVGAWFEVTGAEVAAFLQDALDNRSSIVNMLLRKATDNDADNRFTFWAEGGTYPPQIVVDYTLPVAMLLPRIQYQTPVTPTQVVGY